MGLKKKGRETWGRGVIEWWVEGERHRQSWKNNVRGIHVNTQWEINQAPPQWTSLLLVHLRMQRLWKNCALDEQCGLSGKWKWCLPKPSHWLLSGLDLLLSEMSPLGATGPFLCQLKADIMDIWNARKPGMKPCTCSPFSSTFMEITPIYHLKKPGPAGVSAGIWIHRPWHKAPRLLLRSGIIFCMSVCGRNLSQLLEYSNS